jgi:2-methylcitrate dehydratase PrpD
LRFETERVGEPLLILASGFRVKRFPNCGSAHRAMDGLLSLRERHGFGADDVAAIDVRAPVSHLNNLMYVAPKDPLQAKFSLEYGLACVLLEGRCGLAEFEPERILRPDVRALYPRIHRHPVDAAEGAFATEIAVTLRSGEVLQTAVAMPCGSLAAPFSTDQYWAKFDQCAGGVMPGEALERARKALNDLPFLPKVAALMSPLGVPFADHRRHLRHGDG